jgi:hypothetical protein
MITNTTAETTSAAADPRPLVGWYSIDDADGNRLHTSVAKPGAAHRIARQIATERGEPVSLCIVFEDDAATVTIQPDPPVAPCACGRGPSTHAIPDGDGARYVCRPCLVEYADRIDDETLELRDDVAGN